MVPALTDLAISLYLPEDVAVTHSAFNGASDELHFRARKLHGRC